MHCGRVERSPATGDVLRMMGCRTSAAKGRWALAFGLVTLLALSGCGETRTKGYILNPSALDQIPVGSSQEQVLVVLGTPSTVATVDGEVFYYISSQTEKPVAFMRASVVDQRVLAVYFDKDRRVSRIANYGVQDGKIFDFVTRTTPNIGKERSFLGQVFKGVMSN
jgi:outer membrane protein assembly factor BamE (lipoprotein component of BamABCDE complex)